jgi:hypothetical protein
VRYDVQTHLFEMLTSSSLSREDEHIQNMLEEMECGIEEILPVTTSRRLPLRLLS